MLHNVVRKDRWDLAARRPGACLLGLAVAGGCLALAAFADAPRATTQPKPLISQAYREYQAKTRGRRDHANRPRFAAAEPVTRGPRGSALAWATTRYAGVKRYHASLFQYQLHFEISHSNKTDRNQFRAPFFRFSDNQTADLRTGQAISHSRQSEASIPVQNLQSFGRQQAPQSGDERRLLQIGLALAIVYVVFLVLWFWGTREDGGRVEGAARF